MDMRAGSRVHFALVTYASKLVSSFLIFFASWTLSCHLIVFLHSGINAIAVCTLILTSIFAWLYRFLGKPTAAQAEDSAPDWGRFRNETFDEIAPWFLIILPLLLYISWLLFWAAGSILLLTLLATKFSERESSDAGIPINKRRAVWIIALTALIAIG